MLTYEEEHFDGELHPLSSYCSLVDRKARKLDVDSDMILLVLFVSDRL
jgi:hypothetical protein